MTTLQWPVEPTCPRNGIARPAAVRRMTIAAGVTLLVAATLGLRLFQAGHWSFWGDELVTYYDASMLFKTSYWHPTGYSSPHEQFIHACPLGFGILGVWHDLVPKSELTARLPLVLFSTLGVLTAVWLVWRSRGPWVAAALVAVLIAWPWGLFHAQNHRPYSIAFFFAVFGFLLADAGFARHDWRRLCAATAFCLLAALSHSSCVLLLAVLTGWQMCKIATDRCHRQRGHWVAAAVMLAALAVDCLLIRHFTRGFMQGAWWYMLPERCLASLVNNLTLPISLAALAAGVWVVATRQRHLYWAVLCSMAVTVACVLGPLVMSFRADYVFAMTLPLHLLAAVALGRVAQTAWQHHWSLGLAALGAVPALILPSIASYYVDGNRPDYRTAAAFVAARAQPGDVLWSRQCVNVRYYLSTPRADLYPADPVAAVDELLQQGRRVWCVMAYSTGGIPPQRLAWLSKRFRLVGDVHPLRFDYHQNGVAVLLAEADAAAETAATTDSKVARRPSVAPSWPHGEVLNSAVFADRRAKVAPPAGWSLTEKRVDKERCYRTALGRSGRERNPAGTTICGAALDRQTGGRPIPER
ncbi:MAG TPA: hypothetical protein VM243_08765 [Phycisphaerae bacterium]|nr:hypothetical protein [Phycisphaerae bacterium]